MNPRPRHSEEPPPAIEHRAADWIGRRDAGLSAAESRELDTWLRADPRHAEAFARLDATARALDRLRVLRPADGAELDPDLPLRPRRRPAWAGWGLAAGLAAALIALAFFNPARRAPEVAAQSVFATAIGDIRKVALPDGSSLDLNTATEVKLAFDRAERRVELVRGEAHFAVAPDAGRPFIVQAGAVRVRAVGTAFSVRLRREAVEVLVTEGRVGVDDRVRDRTLLPAAAPAIAAPLLAAGQRAIISVAPETAGPAPLAVVADVTPVEIAQTLAWQEKRLEFGPLPLREVVAEFNRYSAVQLVVHDPATAEISVGGSFRAGDWQTLVRLLETNFDVEATRRDAEVVLRRR